MKIITLLIAFAWFHGPNVAYAELVPVSRSQLKGMGTYENIVARHTAEYIKKTVNDIYEGVLHNAGLGTKLGYHHKVSTLWPLGMYPVESYMPEIMRQARVLFPDCEVEFTPPLGVGIYWA